jgi:diguanylate cyclase (GGDEF)-like protein/PAS domain S-box-containing protein
MLNNDRHALPITTIAFCAGLVWLFFGEMLVDLLVSRSNAQLLYAFFSGIIVVVVVIGIFYLLRIILKYAGWLNDEESIQQSIYSNMLIEEGDGLFFKDKRGYYRLMNETAKQLFDLEDRKVVGKKDFQLMDVMRAHKIENEDKKILQNDETVIWETHKNTGDGDEVWLCKKIPCRNHKGQLLGVLGYCRNITVLKTFQNLNKDLEERYQNLFDKLPYPVLIIDALNLKPYSFNRAMTSLLGYSIHQFSSMRFNVHLSDENNEKFVKTMSQLLEMGGGEFEARLQTIDRDDVDVSGYAQTLKINDRIYLHMLLHDVTELHRSTEELISSEVKYRSLFEHASDAILIIDIKTLRILDANDVALRSLGYRRDVLMELTLLDIEADGGQRRISDELSNLEIYNHTIYEHVIRNKKGAALQVEINAHKVNYGVHQVYQFVIRDIGERKKTEQALINSEQRYRQMFENNQAIKLVIDVDNYKIEAANRAAADFYGYQQCDMPGMSLDKINIHSREKILSLIQKSREEHLGYYTCPHRLVSGDIRFVEVRDGVMEIDGQALLYTIIHDVTESRRAEDQLLIASKMFDCTSDAVMITDRNNKIISINQAFTELTGFQLSEVINISADSLQVGRDQKIITPGVIEAIQKNGSWHGEVWQRLKNGESCNTQATINVVMNEQSEITNHIIMLSAATIEGQQGGEVNFYTTLTGLPNRKLFVNQLRQAIDRSLRSEKQIAVLLIDVRNFSKINKENSRDVGDQILKAMARRLKHNVRESDTVSHFEKDNFAVLLEELADVQQTGIVAQKIISTLAEEYQIEGDVISIDVSIGISVSPEDGTDEHVLLDKAEHALRAAQQIPGSSFRLRSQHMNETALQWLQTDLNLHAALRNREFIVAYLPQINLADNRVEAVEALVRWRTSNGVLLPVRFLPNAEQSGFISAIGNQIIAMALADFSRWQKQGMNLEYLMLNLSPAQIMDDLEVYMLEQCVINDLTPDSIMLDFNEQNFIASSQEQRIVLLNLQASGFRICIDDFGSGNASLSCLLQCPVDAIKIDRAFTLTCAENIEIRHLLSGVIALAAKLDMLVVAEGVESADSYHCLKELGCVHMQGYYLSEPLQDSQVPGFINNFAKTIGETHYEKT